ncbi:aldose epimerase family protein [Parapedobacter sp. GCM10030251]|uniref:aldose epimerase family protein n=1 Tax=Parapedobacter sp. GCM10030251 TaxID=3273419 RepID=UPI00361568FC
MANVISKEDWGTHENHDVFRYRMKNSTGAYVELTNFGASIVGIVVPDRHGHLGNVVLGFPEIKGYIDDRCYLGTTIGRYANRIAFAGFDLDGHRYNLKPNDGPHTNHGGIAGFHKRIFDVKTEGDAVSFQLTSTDGDGGFPGNLRLTVAYRWSEANELQIQYEATCDKKTILNVTNHAYFNLSGSKTDIVDHRLQVRASHVLETTAEYIPTGVLTPCSNPSFSAIKGLNHCYVLHDAAQNRLRKAALLRDTESGRTLEVYTTYPGLVVYSGDFLSGNVPGYAGIPYRPFDGVCLECQYFPDSPNHPNFPSTVLDIGAVYNEQILYKFSVT